MSAPGPMSARRAVKDFEVVVDGKKYFVGAEDNVWVGVAQTSLTCPSVSTPEKFDPARFIFPARDDGKGANALPFFGWGLRSCPGYKFAELQIAVLLCLIATKKIQFKEDPTRPVKPVYKPTLVPDNNEGCWLVVSKNT